MRRWWSWYIAPLLLVALKIDGALRYWREGNQMSDRYIAKIDLNRNPPDNWRIYDTEEDKWETLARFPKHALTITIGLLNKHGKQYD